MKHDVIPEPIEQWLDSISGLEVMLFILAVIGVIAALWAFAKKVWPDLVQFVETIRALSALPAFITRTDRDLAELKHEVRPNGGGSLRDVADRLEIRVEKVEAHQTNDHQRISELNRMLAQKEKP